VQSSADMGSERKIVFADDDAGDAKHVEREGGYVLTEPWQRVFTLHESRCGHLGPYDDVTVRTTANPRRWAPLKYDLVDWRTRRQALNSWPAQTACRTPSLTSLSLTQAGRSPRYAPVYARAEHSGTV
jgi:hypothetical protein